MERRERGSRFWEGLLPRNAGGVALCRRGYTNALENCTHVKVAYRYEEYCGYVQVDCKDAQEACSPSVLAASSSFIIG